VGCVGVDDDDDCDDDDDDEDGDTDEDDDVDDDDGGGNDDVGDDADDEDGDDVDGSDSVEDLTCHLRSRGAMVLGAASAFLSKRHHRTSECILQQNVCVHGLSAALWRTIIDIAPGGYRAVHMICAGTHAMPCWSMLIVRDRPPQRLWLHPKTAAYTFVQHSTSDYIIVHHSTS